MPHDAQVSLLDSKGAKTGFLSVQLVPYPADREAEARAARDAAMASGGNGADADDGALAAGAFTQGRIEEIMGRAIVIDLCIKKAMGLPATRNASVQVRMRIVCLPFNEHSAIRP